METCERPDLLLENRDSENDLDSDESELGEFVKWDHARPMVKKSLAVLQKAMTKNNSSWSSREWHTKTKWQSSPVDAGAQSSHERWSGPKPWMKGKEVVRPVHQLACLVRDKKGTWIKSCDESSKRKSDVMAMADKLLSCAKIKRKDQGHNDEGMETFP